MQSNLTWKIIKLILENRKKTTSKNGGSTFFCSSIYFLFFLPKLLLNILSKQNFNYYYFSYLEYHYCLDGNSEQWIIKVCFNQKKFSDLGGDPIRHVFDWNLVYI